MEPHRGGGVLKVGLLAVALLLALGPSAADADCTGNSIVGVLTETIERIDWITTDEGELHRVASAKEIGTLSNACGTLGVLAGVIKVQPALSDVVWSPSSPDFGTGPINGSVKFFPSSTPGVTLKGAVSGQLDFRPALGTPPMPFVVATGTWTIQGSDLGGRFAGYALVPFACPVSDTGFCYLDVTGALGNPGGLVPLTSDEVQPAPSAKFVVTLIN